MPATEPKSLAKDEKGAVLLVAVFMSAFLVGALWYIIGIGDAAIYRQYLQDGADAVSFGSAVYHARGMNILALINLVMAAVLMVLVAFKIAQVLLIAANIASCAAGAWFNPICDMTSAAEEPFANLVDKVEKIVGNILKILHTTSDAVAYGMPWVAEGKAIVVAQEYKITVDGGFMISISLVPGSIENALGGLVPAEKKTATAGASSPTTPTGETKKSESGATRKGLPVQDDEFSNLCKHAGQNVAHLVFAPFHFLPGFGTLGGVVEGLTAKMVGGIVSALPGYFCGDSDGKDKTSKKVYDAATAGDDYFAVWGFGWGNLDDQTSGKKGVSIAGWGTKASDASAFTKFGISKAEFYYEPKPGDPKKWGKDLSDRAPFGLGGTAEGGLADEAMWNMRWRARLRRLRLPMPKAGAWLATKVNDKIKVPIIGDLLKWPADKAGELIDAPVAEYIGGLTSGWIIH